ncbi:MAG: sigma-54-dependent Fis family transcriptional regulator [Desulfobacterales bacterium]|nr:sigma-54-dependent Fis family transcriptional regulator [Desulfobacterales bacterium]
MEKYKILFVDDDSAIRSIVDKYLSKEGYKVSLAESGVEALKLLKDSKFDIVFTDFKMPGINGIELLSRIKEYSPEIEVIIVTGHGTLESAIEAMKTGSYDYLQKPFKLDLLKIIIDRIIEEKKIKRENVLLKKRIKQRHKYEEMVGISLRMQEIYEIIDRMKPHNPNVLIQGESGTGKELTAHVIHKTSQRKTKPFTALNCSSFVKELPKTRTHETFINLLEPYEGGTIFLDEIAEFPPGIQIEFLDGLKPKPAKSSGNKDKNDLDLRIIAATNTNIKESLETGKLERKFYNHLNAVSIHMPPLRDRKEDIYLLIYSFLDKFKSRSPNNILNVSSEAMDYLLKYNWPGNVIQLENVIERSFAFGVDTTIQLEDLPDEIKTFGKISKVY